VVLTIVIGNTQGGKMAEYQVIRKGRRIIGRFEEDRVFHIAWSKSNVKEGKVTLPIDVFDAEIVNKTDRLTLTYSNDETDIYYWLDVNEFMAYAQKIKKNYVVPLYTFKNRRL